MNTYSDGNSLEYNFDMFETHTKASAAPQRKYEREERKKPELKLVENKTVLPRRKDDGRAILRSAMIVLFAVMLLSGIALQINAGARSYELSRQIEVVENKMAEAKTENVRLNNSLNSITTIENIDDYARNVLGMTKYESYQIKCIDLSEEDQVLYSSSGFSLFDWFGKNG